MLSWAGTPTSRETKVAGHETYIADTNSSPSSAVLTISDLFGWKFANVRLLADPYSRDADTTVYVPRLPPREDMPIDLILEDKWAEIDLPGPAVLPLGRDSRAGDLRVRARDQGDASQCRCGGILLQRVGGLPGQ